MPGLDSGFSQTRTPEEIPVCADPVLDRYDDVPTRSHVLTLAQKRTAECLRADSSYELDESLA